MKSLVILALIGLVGQTMAEQRFVVDHTNEIKLQELTSKLGKELVAPGAEGNDDQDPTSAIAEEVVSLLAKTEDKTKEEAILHSFSVKELLELNSYTWDDCLPIRQEKRRDLCESVCTEEQSTITDYSLFFGVDYQFDADDFTRFNVCKYCWNVLLAMESFCSY